MIAYPDQILNDTYLDQVYAEVSLLKYQESAKYQVCTNVSGSKFYAMHNGNSNIIYLPHSHANISLHSTTSLSSCSLRLSYSM